MNTETQNQLALNASISEFKFRLIHGNSRQRGEQVLKSTLL